MFRTLVSCVMFVGLFTVVQAHSYGDVRCKCVCPKDVLDNNVVVKFVTDVEDCTCNNLINLEESLCLRCKCKYEKRNTLLIKVVVTLVVVVLVILIVYMIGLSVYSHWKPVQSLSVRSDALQERLIQRSRTLTRLDSTVSKWKDSVEDQRRNVYNHHTMLS